MPLVSTLRWRCLADIRLGEARVEGLGRNSHALLRSPPRQSPQAARGVSCPHENFEANVNVFRLLERDGDMDPHVFAADVTIECRDCREPFGFIGVPYGLRPDAPTMSVDNLSLRVPLVSATALKLRALVPWGKT